MTLFAFGVCRLYQWRRGPCCVRFHDLSLLPMERHEQANKIRIAVLNRTEHLVSCMWQKRFEPPVEAKELYGNNPVKVCRETAFEPFSWPLKCEIISELSLLSDLFSINSGACATSMRLIALHVLVIKSRYPHALVRAE